MRKHVLVIGEGVLADHVIRILTLDGAYAVLHQPEVSDTVPKGTALAVVLDDAWHPYTHCRAEEVFGGAKIPWLRGFVAFGAGIIGPLVLPGIPGCSQCADIRAMMADSERREMEQIRLQFAVQGGAKRDVWASQSGLLHVAHLVVREMERALNYGHASAFDGHILYANLSNLDTSRHAFLPNPECPICSQLPEDSREQAKICLSPSLKVDEKSYRTRRIGDIQETLMNHYFDVRTGLMNGKVHDLITPFAAVSMNLPFTMGDEGTAGRSHSYEESELTAVLEGLERYCGLQPRGKRSVVHDSYANLKEAALSPVEVGLHTPQLYVRPDSPFQAFDADIPVDWVWGYSLTGKRAVLVPELLAYYSLGCKAGFVYETSNGCAVGGNQVEAIFHGILEIVERDAFLMTWYGQLPLPRIDMTSIDDTELQWMLARLKVAAGYDVYLYQATMENGIPSVFAIAKNRRSKGANLVCAAGSHIDAMRAVKGAVHELAGMLLRFDEKLEQNRETYLRMYRDSSLVKHMEDHSMLYGLPEAEERLSFLLDDKRPLKSFADAFAGPKQQPDLTDDLKDLLQTFTRLGLDVIVVNQTAPELTRNGLYCVKVLIPGMLPMTFGHHLIRLEGLHRVLHVPADLGYAEKPLTREQLNPYPHPFC